MDQSEKNDGLCHVSTQPLRDQAEIPESCVDLPWSKEQRKERVCQAVVRLVVKLERVVRAELSVAQRLSLLQELKPKVVKIAALLPKPVVETQQVGIGRDVGQTLQQRLECLMAKNIKLVLDDLGRSELAHADAAAQPRAWLVRNLFRFLGRQVEYAVRWNRPYPPRVWATLHELYYDLRARNDVSPELAIRRGGDAFAPEIEYKRLLLLGLVGQLVPPADRSHQLIEALTSMARESQLVHPVSYSGAFDVFVVEISQDAPPRVSAALNYELNGWVLEPAPAFLDLVRGSRS